MKIKEITWRHGRDFRAVYQCDAGHEHEDRGYDDAYFHDVVIPKMTCPECSETTDG